MPRRREPSAYAPRPFLTRAGHDLRLNKALYLMVLPALVYFIIFHYGPMYGAQIAFRDYSAGRGIGGSRWVGLKYFAQFFGSHYFFRLLRNTIVLNIYEVVFGFPAPIILALLLNELRRNTFKRTVQTITYLPYFISLVVICGIIVDFTAVDDLVNQMTGMFGEKPVPFLAHPQYFRTIFVSTQIWQFVGWNSIIYLAALTRVDPELYEAARIDGAGHMRIFARIAVPMSTAVMAVMVLFYGVYHWNSWFYSMVFLRSRKLYPLQLVLREILIINDTGTMTSDVGDMSSKDMVAITIKYATIVISTVPIMCLYPFLQNYFVKGVMVGAIKG